MTVMLEKIFCNQVDIKSQYSGPFSPLGTSVPPCGVEGQDEGNINQWVISWIPPHPNPLPKGEGVYVTAVSLSPLILQAARNLVPSLALSKLPPELPPSAMD
jgi:hypothetical protein